MGVPGYTVEEFLMASISEAWWRALKVDGWVGSCELAGGATNPGREGLLEMQSHSSCRM